MSAEDMVTLKIDPHVHSDASYDAHDSVELILEHASDIGLDGVVITDHDTIEESLHAAELAESYGLIGIPGVEVSTKHGHLLAIGVEEMPELRQPMMETIKQVRDMGGVAIIPHPFQWMRHGVRKKHIDDCDAIEVYNAWLFTGYKNRKAAQYALRHGYPGVGASDAHSVTMVGRAYTQIQIDPAKVDPHNISKEDIDRDIILQSIKNGSTNIRGKRKPMHDSALHYTKGATLKTAYTVKTQVANILPW